MSKRTMLLKQQQETKTFIKTLLKSMNKVKLKKQLLEELRTGSSSKEIRLSF